MSPLGILLPQVRIEITFKVWEYDCSWHDHRECTAPAIWQLVLALSLAETHKKHSFLYSFSLNFQTFLWKGILDIWGWEETFFIIICFECMHEAFPFLIKFFFFLIMSLRKFTLLYHTTCKLSTLPCRVQNSCGQRRGIHNNTSSTPLVKCHPSR